MSSATPQRRCLPATIVSDIPPGKPLFRSSPFVTALVFENEASDARDHCANERNFLSWLRLSIYMCVVALAIMLSISFKTRPSSLERKLARPLGALFWGLSLLCLTTGCATYVNTIRKYSRRTAVVQSGFKTRIIFGIVGTGIIGSCLLFITMHAMDR